MCERNTFNEKQTPCFSINVFLLFLFLPYLATSVHAQPKGQWKDLPPMPSKRTEVAVAILDNSIYVVGGFTQKGIADQVEVWDSESGKWSNIPPLPRPLHHTTVSAVNGKLYVIGGFDSGMWTPVDTTYEYSPKKRDWTVKARMPTRRGALAATVIDDKIYVVGGANRKIFTLVNTPALEVYDQSKYFSIGSTNDIDFVIDYRSCQCAPSSWHAGFYRPVTFFWAVFIGGINRCPHARIKSTDYV
jgi:hypothetical protein